MLGVNPGSWSASSARAVRSVALDPRVPCRLHIHDPGCARRQLRFKEDGLYAYQACIDSAANPAFIPLLLAQLESNFLTSIEDPLEGGPVRLEPDNQNT